MPNDEQVKNAVELLNSIPIAPYADTLWQIELKGDAYLAFETLLNLANSFLKVKGFPEAKEKSKPSIAELEAILDSNEKHNVEILPDGSIIGITKNAIEDYGNKQFNSARSLCILAAIKGIPTEKEIEKEIDNQIEKHFMKNDNFENWVEFKGNPISFKEDLAQSLHSFLLTKMGVR